MWESFDGRVDAGPSTVLKRQKAANEMQQLLDTQDSDMNTAERSEIIAIRKDLFALQRETARITIQNVENLKKLTPAQVITLIKANYKNENNTWNIQEDDGFVWLKQIVFDMLGTYTLWVDGMRWNGSKTSESEYRSKKWLQPVGQNDKLLECFITDLKAWRTAQSPTPSNGTPFDDVNGVSGISAEWSDISRRINTADASYELNIPDIRLKPWVKERLLSNCTFDDVMNEYYGKNYKPYAQYIKQYAKAFNISLVVFANLLIKENPFFADNNPKRTVIGQMNLDARNKAKDYAAAFKLDGKPIAVQNFSKNVWFKEQIKAAAAYLALKHTECNNPYDALEAAQLYHAWKLNDDKTARYYARYNPTIIKTYNMCVAWKPVTADTITSKQYNMSARIYYGTLWFGGRAVTVSGKKESS